MKEQNPLPDDLAEGYLGPSIQGETRLLARY
jgi:hypothetical protein